jgi:hypothetical protein
MQTLDFVTDNNPGWLAPVLETLPSYVKSASVITPDITAELSDLAFAGKNRTFPIHTKEATFLSAVYLNHLGKSDSKEMENVKHAAAAHGIKKDLDLFLHHTSLNVKTANAAPIKKASYALTVNNQSYYPVNSFEQVQDSARELAADFNAGKLPSSWFKSASTVIMQKAAEFKMPSNEIVLDVREAGAEREPDFERAAILIQRRKLAKVDEAALAIYTDIVKTAAANPDKMDEHMDLIHDMDRDFGIKYSSIQLNPCQIFYTGISKEEIKKASANNVIIGGVMVPALEFNRIKEDDIRLHMGQPQTEFVMDMCKAATADPVLASEMAAELPSEIHRIVLSHLIA